MGHSVKLLGVLNITPDSFSDGGLYTNTDTALAYATQLFANGATWVDVGAESTKPGAVAITPDEEWARLEPILPVLLQKYPGRISLDTRHPETAQRFCAAGGTVINDVSGGINPNMLRVAAEQSATIILNHFPAADPTAVHSVEIDSLAQVLSDLNCMYHTAVEAGIAEDKIILDPGIGFGKTMRLNWQLLTVPSILKTKQILIGHSKKRFMGDTRFEPEMNQLVAKMAAQMGAAWLRVHDPAWYQ